MTGAPTAGVLGIDLTVGDPGQVRACARRMRRGAGDVRAAAERQSDARRSARGGWEGAAADAYDDLSAVALAETDAQARRVRRAADDVDAVADRLADLGRALDDVRAQARADGHLASDTLVQPRFGTELRPTEQASFERLRERAQQARDDYAAWVDDRLGRAATEAADQGAATGLDRALGRLGDDPVTGPAPGAPTAPGVPGAATGGAGRAGEGGHDARGVPDGGRGSGAAAGVAAGGTGGTAGGVAGGAVAGAGAAYVVSALGPPPTRDHATSDHPLPAGRGGPDPLPLRPAVPEPLAWTATRDDGGQQP